MAEGRLLRFPAGLPAFEWARRFRLAPAPQAEPFEFLESVDAPGLRFVCAPMPLLAPDYPLLLDNEDRLMLELPPGGEGSLRVLCILSFPESGPPTANLLAPLVIHVEAGVGMQLVPAEAQYPVDFPLPRPAAEVKS